MDMEIDDEDYGDEYDEDYGDEYDEDYGEVPGEDHGEDFGENLGEEYDDTSDSSESDSPNTAVSADCSGLAHRDCRVHPRSLVYDAKRHQWQLGAFAHLLDSAVHEICNGATYVKVDMLINKKDGGSKMLLVQDNGGGMNPDEIRRLMSRDSLKHVNTKKILPGQYGYGIKKSTMSTIEGFGFQASTMRLGADVIVFSRCRERNGQSPTQSICLLSYTFLRSTGRTEIVSPIVDYENGGREWIPSKIDSSSVWKNSLEAIVQWSPYTSEGDLMNQFSFLEDHGTRIVIYNLWEDGHGKLELDFDTDTKDIQIRGVQRDEKQKGKAQNHPNLRHLLTYRHSLRSYAALLYLKRPIGFRIILRGEEVVHHKLVDDMRVQEMVTTKPYTEADGMPTGSTMVTIGYLKDVDAQIDIQGFCVYHNNRLIKPFWSADRSNGRGVIGVLEANFLEPTIEKQEFEPTILRRWLEAQLLQLQQNWLSTKCDAPADRINSDEDSPCDVSAAVPTLVDPKNRVEENSIMEEEG